ncbi:hypothetical protein [Acidiphilium sp. PM]|uniref:hypothetical protein n=1 Tax=Acidiphilium sp. PM TaxID=1043206 RepID=UPI001F527C41|nr:hypothetical protein [Acidiphilium sp. PM]
MTADEMAAQFRELAAEPPQNPPEALPLVERLREWHQHHPMPPPTGLKADKAFFDDLSGEPPDEEAP